MKYRDLQLQTQREAPNNARTEGFAFLVRAGCVTRENTPTKLGEIVIDHLKKAAVEAMQDVPAIGNDRETFLPIASGDVEVIHCPSCKYTERLELARAKKSPLPQEDPLPLDKVSTPDCNTIESLAQLLNIPKDKTAKALMFTRTSDGKFIFVVLRGDMQLSEAKLKAQVGEVRAATTEEIVRAGAAPHAPLDEFKLLVVHGIFIYSAIPTTMRQPNRRCGQNKQNSCNILGLLLSFPTIFTALMTLMMNNRPFRPPAWAQDIEEWTRDIEETLKINPAAHSHKVNKSRSASFKYAVAGILHVVRYQRSAHLQGVVTIIVFTLSFILQIPKIELLLMFGRRAWSGQPNSSTQRLNRR